MKYKDYLYENVWLTNNKLYARLYNPETKKTVIKCIGKDTYIPPMYVETKDSTVYKSFNKGTPLKKIDFNTAKELKQFIKDNKNRRKEASKLGTTKPEIYGADSIPFEFIRQEFPEDSNHIYHTLFIDIETRSIGAFPHVKDADQEVTMIQLYSTLKQEYIILGTRPWEGEYKSQYGRVRYVNLQNEVQLLNKFLDILTLLNPAIISGFNSNAFDMPYLYYRMAKLGLKANKLSPIGVVQCTETKYIDGEFSTVPLTGSTHDGLEYLAIKIAGVILLDYRDLVLKYGFLRVSSYNLNGVASGYGIKGKVDSSKYASFDGNYSGKGYIFGDEPEDEEALLVYNAQVQYRDNPTEENKAVLDAVVYNNFVNYSVRDVEVLLEIDAKARLIETARTIAHICKVNADDVGGTLKQWHSYVYNDAYNDNVILSYHQQGAVKDTIFRAGWTSAKPGLYNYVLSVDFASLYPSVFQAANIGADTLIEEEDLPQELIDIRAKYFDFFTNENFNKESGALVKKYKDDNNNIPEEMEYLVNVLKEDFSAVLRKYNVGVTPNGYFYSNEVESYSAKAMRDNVKSRYKSKYRAIELAGELETIKEELAKESTPELLAKYKAVHEEEQYEESMSQIKKTFLTSNYGSNALASNPFSNGRLTAASVTIMGRMLIQYVCYKISEEIEKYINKDIDLIPIPALVQSDTDSGYFNLDGLVQKYLNNPTEQEVIAFVKSFFEKKLAPVINNTIADIAYKMNLKRPEVLKMDQEILSSAFCSQANKRYFARVIMNDGNILQEPKSKITGISLVSASTPTGAREILAPVLDIILDKDIDKLRNYLSNNKDNYDSMHVDKLARVMGINAIDKYDWYTKSNEPRPGQWKSSQKFAFKNGDKMQTAPMNSKAAAVHNHLIDELNLGEAYEKIVPSDKVKILYVQVPNPITGLYNNAIAYKDTSFLTKTGIIDYIDREIQWQKEVVQKVDILIEPINWNIKKEISLEDW